MADFCLTCVLYWKQWFCRLQIYLRYFMIKILIHKQNHTVLQKNFVYCWSNLENDNDPEKKYFSASLYDLNGKSSSSGYNRRINLFVSWTFLYLEYTWYILLTTFYSEEKFEIKLKPILWLFKNYDAIISLQCCQWYKVNHLVWFSN